MNGQLKDLRKAAFAAGFGFTMGKFMAGLVEGAVNGIALSVTKRAAKNGNEIAQDVCKKAGIKISPEEKEEESKVKMGFHCK